MQTRQTFVKDDVIPELAKLRISGPEQNLATQTTRDVLSMQCLQHYLADEPESTAYLRRTFGNQSVLPLQPLNEQ